MAIEEIFIRSLKSSERSNPTAIRNMSKIPDREGYEKVYKPYGEQGRGYYYLAEKDFSDSMSNIETNLPCDECGRVPKTLYKYDNSSNWFCSEDCWQRYNK